MGSYSPPPPWVRNSPSYQAKQAREFERERYNRAQAQNFLLALRRQNQRIAAERAAESVRRQG
jgi:hypothetical protein